MSVLGALVLGGGARVIGRVFIPFSLYPVHFPGEFARVSYRLRCPAAVHSGAPHDPASTAAASASRAASIAVACFATRLRCILPAVTSTSSLAK